MSNARNLARLLPNASGQLPDAAMASGSVLQVVQGVKSDTAVISAGNYYTVVSVVITPSSASSKILLSAHITGYAYYDTVLYFRRDTTPIGLGDAASNRARGFAELPAAGREYESSNVSGEFLDTPNTTSPITYSVILYNASNTAFINRSANDQDSGTDSRTISTITAREIAA